MESTTSYMERYILIPHTIIKNIGKLGGVDAFRLYAELLFQRNWKNEVCTTPNLLLAILNRSEQYWRKNLKNQISILVHNKIITIDKDVRSININETVVIKILFLPGHLTKVKCINEEIFKLQTTTNVNTIFAIFVFVKRCINKETGYARVKMKTVAKGIGVSEKTVEKAIKTLETEGFISVNRGKYLKDLSMNECNKYRVHDYNSLIYKAKHGLVSFAEKQKISENENVEKEMDKIITEFLAYPEKYSPCVFKGQLASIFREYCDVIKHESIFEIYTLNDITEVVCEYSGILYVPSDFITLDIKNITNGIEELIFSFIENSVVSIVLLLAENSEVTNNRIKSQIRHIFE